MQVIPELLPLLKSAQLQADRNLPAEATQLFAEILTLEPDWPDALDAQFWFPITQGDRSLDYATLDARLRGLTTTEGLSAFYATRLHLADRNRAEKSYDFVAGVNFTALEGVDQKDLSRSSF
jgi:hypothetical protein